MKLNTNVQAFLATSFSLLMWASAYPGIRAALSGYTPGHLILFRFSITALVLAIYAVVTRIRLPHWRDLPQIAFASMVGVTVYQLVLNYGQTIVSAGISSLLVSTSPIFTALLASIMLRERIGKRGWLGIGLGFAGAVLIVLGTKSSFEFEPVALLLLFAAVLQGAFFVLQKPLLQRYTPLETTAYIHWVAIIPLLYFAPGLPEQIANTPLSVTAVVFYLGIFPSALANLSWAYALSRSQASRMGSFLNVVPALSLIMSWVWLGEVPTIVALLGGVVAVFGIVLVNTRHRRA